MEPVFSITNCRKNKMKFQIKLANIQKKNNSLLCAGLDSDFEKIPKHLKKLKYPLYEFNKAIIESTSDFVCAYKPNSAFYEGLGAEGILQLKMTCDFLHKNYSYIPIILDAKRADIGNTNEGYVKYAFDYLGVDAITLHPYLGEEALKPFLERADKGCIILCRTSNPGASEFQDLKVNKKPLYELVATHVIEKWNYNQNCCLVVGATYPEELKAVRKIAPSMTFLVPGIGAQGGDLQKTLRFGLTKNADGLIINAARSVIFASNEKDFALKARMEAQKLNEEININRR